MDWAQVKAVIFDVDGTLYSQFRMRRHMARRLLFHCVSSFSGWRDIQMLRKFRRIRENLSFEEVENLERVQYESCALALNRDTEDVIQVVRKWMFQIPLQYIADCRFSGINTFFEELNRRGIKIAVFSDFPAREKLNALGLSAEVLVCATDSEVNGLKPNPKGLLRVAELLSVPVAECLVIGDRDDRDGEAARRAGVPYLILTKCYFKKKHQFQGYDQLIKCISQNFTDT